MCKCAQIHNNLILIIQKVNSNTLTYEIDILCYSFVVFCSVIIGLYGWFGSLDSRMQRGELESAERIQPVQYIDYDERLFSSVSLSERLYVFAFSISVQEEVTATPTLVTAVPTAFPIYPVLGAIVGAVLVVLVLVLLVVTVCVFGKRRNQSKEKRYRFSSVMD